ncbi:aspartate carbamoyltransferase catalytic subunit [Alphaproteobacteria bacterium]|jgi:aspartate carbamoyltransferase catalytic subunit|nr:aspartate carbamoyltransferase catalytic subunit [Alphaproteobacteria bacterium]MDA9189941.1 aspartate carbamoyltransferase catalytic subunit [Alphaproteobacteria bacterium]MDC0394734.1 aspartate carbamoyltransferase catalytic subunit [Alphaproteobacteria bacterium]MDC0461418.1 aspartate carbamoyltransferase catalytic subunit [Alphaproteobacteria bacterium]
MTRDTKIANDTPPPAAMLSNKHLLGIQGMPIPEINALLERAHFFADRPKALFADVLANITVLNMFFENSTRTRVSFELAAKRLGASVLNISVNSSSVKKGETLIDTATTLNAMRPDILVARHHASGAPLLLSQHVDAAVINAGDGRHEHPTQALLDALTIKRSLGKIAGLKIAICGDIDNSRVARSNLYLLSALGADVRFVSPATLVSPYFSEMGVPVYTDMEQGISGCDIIMMLRLQTERMEGRETPSQHEYFHFFGLDTRKLQKAAPNAFIMHPGPMNRGVEIDSKIADDNSKSLIRTQVELGVATRMACLEAIAGASTRVRI